jgi:hypothetical protein
MYDIKVDYNRDHVYMYNAQNVFAPTMHCRKLETTVHSFRPPLSLGVPPLPYFSLESRNIP